MKTLHYSLTTGILDLNEFSLSDDKTQISGLSLNGFAADIEGIWTWLDIRRDGQFKIIDQDNPTRFALENETLYLVRTPLISREVNLEWDANLTGALAYTKTEGHDIRQISLLNTSAIYRSAIQTGFPHKSSFSKDGRKVGLEIIGQEKNTLSLKSKAFDVSKYAEIVIDQLKQYSFVNRSSSMQELSNSSSNLNYFFDYTLADLEEFNEEEENSRLAYKTSEMKNGLTLGIKAEDDIPIPSLSLPEVNVNVGVCKYVFKAGAFVEIKAGAEFTGMIKGGSKTYINNEKPSEEIDPYLESAFGIEVYAGFNPKVKIELCKGAIVEFGAKEGATMDFIKIAPPPVPSGDWVTYPFLTDGLELSGSIYYDIKVGEILEYHGTWTAGKFKTSEIFK